MMDTPDDDMFQQPRKMFPLRRIIQSMGHAPGIQNASLFLEMSSHRLAANSRDTSSPIGKYS